MRLGVAEGVARGALDAEEGHDVAVVALGDVFHVVGVHADEAADLELLARAGVVELGALLDLALVDAHVGELAVLAVLELEAEGHRLLGGVGLEDDLLLVLVQVEGHVLDLGGVGEVARDAVEEDLHALVLVGRAHEDGHHLLGDAALAQGADDLLVGRRCPRAPPP